MKTRIAATSGKETSAGAGLAQKITPFLWFDDNAEEAVDFYTSIFENSKIVTVTRYGDAASAAANRPKGMVMTILFQLEGQEFMALNGGPTFKFSPAISFLVSCQTQEEIDRLWSRLTEGGEEIECGWLRDRFGLSWQIAPAEFSEMIADKDPAKVERFMQAMLQMKKLDIATLKRAYEQS